MGRLRKILWKLTKSLLTVFIFLFGVSLFFTPRSDPNFENLRLVGAIVIVIGMAYWDILVERGKNIERGQYMERGANIERKRRRNSRHE